MFNIGTVETSASGMISKKASYLASYVARENGTRFWKKCGGLCVLSFPTPNAGHSQKNTMSDPERFISSESSQIQREDALSLRSRLLVPIQKCSANLPVRDAPSNFSEKRGRLVAEFLIF